MLNRPVATLAIVLAAILLLLVIAACGDAPTPRPTLEINPPPTSTVGLAPTPNLAPIPTPTLTPVPTPRPTASPAEFALTLTDETTWGDIFNLLDAVERDCIREDMGADIDEYLQYPVLVFDSFQGWEARTYSCISPEKSRMLFTGTLRLALEYDGFTLSDEEIACMESWAMDKDMAQVVRSLDESEEVIRDVFVCVVDSYADIMLKDMTAGYDADGEVVQCMESVFELFSKDDKIALFFGYSSSEMDELWEQIWSCTAEYHEYDDAVAHQPGVYWSDPLEGKFASIYAFNELTCGTLESGKTLCWGFDGRGVTGPPNIEFQSISMSDGWACGLAEGGMMRCWGEHYKEADYPYEVTFSSIAVGPTHSCGIRADNQTIRCWGDNSFGQVGLVPRGKFTDITTRANHSCAIREDGKVFCWGAYSDEIHPTLPVVSLAQISAGDVHTCGITEDGLAFCWGQDFEGQASPPKARFLSISSGGYRTCGLLVDGSVMCWGMDDTGVEPPDVAFKELATGYSHVCGIAMDGRVACWGWSSWNGHVPPGAKRAE